MKNLKRKRMLFFSYPNKNYKYVSVQYAENGNRLTAPTVLVMAARGEDAFYTSVASNRTVGGWNEGLLAITRPIGFRWGDLIEVDWRPREVF